MTFLILLDLDESFNSWAMTFLKHTNNVSKKGKHTQWLIIYHHFHRSQNTATNMQTQCAYIDKATGKNPSLTLFYVEQGA